MRLIAGIDPGTTTGICLIDLKGHCVLIKSMKNVGKETIIEEMMKHGKVVAIATDKVPIPDTIMKIGAMMNVKVFSPSRSMSQEYKTNMMKRFGIITKNLHQRDACAAALWLYHKFENKFRHIDSMDIEEDKKEKVKEMIIKGYSIKNVLTLERIEEEKKKPNRKYSNSSRKTLEYIKYLESSVERLIDENRSLQYDLEEIKRKLKSAEDEIYKLKRKIRSGLYRDIEVKRLRAEITRLKKVIHNMKIKSKKQRNRLNENQEKLQKSKQSVEKKVKHEKVDLKNLLHKLIDEYRSSKKKRG